VDPGQRLTCAQALQHPYLAGLEGLSGGRGGAPESSGVRGGRGGRGDPMDEDMPSPPAAR
jgi:cyclin-dependent kinase-like